MNATKLHDNNDVGKVSKNGFTASGHAIHRKRKKANKALTSSIDMHRFFIVIATLICTTAATAQTLSLDSCRALALRSNKQLGIARVKREAATQARKAARTKYLPHIDLTGGYMYSSREISLLSDEQKYALSHLGTSGIQKIGDIRSAASDIMAQQMAQGLNDLVQANLITPAEANMAGTIAGQMSAAMKNAAGAITPAIENAVNQFGERIVEAFKTNTHHIFTASAMLTQPVYMGGAIKAGNEMADIAERIETTGIEAKQHDVLYSIDNAYWTVVSLRHKQKLAEGYLELVEKLNNDVHKMITHGVATRADGLKVDVAVNEADMTKAKVDNALVLAKMYLCQLCGIDLNSDIKLEDEENEDMETEMLPEREGNDEQMAARLKENRPELQMLAGAIDLSKERVKIAKAGYLPQVALMGGVVFSNPSVYNGFERKFKGAFNVGVMVRVPVLDWGETMYKVRMAKCASNIAQLTYDEAQEMMELQVTQCNFRVREANKNLATAKKNISRAEENLRCADLGFREGVMQTTEVMEAQTAWLQAQTMKIDAEIDVKMSETALKKALGEM